MGKERFSKLSEEARPDIYGQDFHKVTIDRLINVWKRISGELTYTDPKAYRENQYNKYRSSWFANVMDEARLLLDEGFIPDGPERVLIEQKLEKFSKMYNDVSLEKGKRKRDEDPDVMMTDEQVNMGDELLNLLNLYAQKIG